MEYGLAWRAHSNPRTDRAQDRGRFMDWACNSTKLVYRSFRPISKASKIALIGILFGSGLSKNPLLSHSQTQRSEQTADPPLHTYASERFLGWACYIALIAITVRFGLSGNPPTRPTHTPTNAQQRDARQAPDVRGSSMESAFNAAQPQLVRCALCALPHTQTSSMENAFSAAQPVRCALCALPHTQTNFSHIYVHFYPQ